MNAKQEFASLWLAGVGALLALAACAGVAAFGVLLLWQAARDLPPWALLVVGALTLLTVWSCLQTRKTQEGPDA